MQGLNNAKIKTPEFVCVNTTAGTGSEDQGARPDLRVVQETPSCDVYEQRCFHTGFDLRIELFLGVSRCCGDPVKDLQTRYGSGREAGDGSQGH